MVQVGLLDREEWGPDLSDEVTMGSLHTWSPEGRLYEIEFEADVRVSPYYRARTYGPPESCFPAEGGDIEVSGVKPLTITHYDADGRFLARRRLAAAELPMVRRSIERALEEPGGPLSALEEVACRA